MELTWITKKFDELTPYELYQILRLRSEIFVVEQNCVYLDADNKDQESYHLMGYQGGELVAYTRLLPPGVSYECASIGRVVTSSSVRGKGIGKLLMDRSISEVFRLFGERRIRIGAQYHLKAFYNSLGFEQSSNIYDEDGIDHIQMDLEPGNRKNTKY